MDRTPPKVVAAVPDSGAVGVRRRELTIRFSKVISERPSSQQATSLADMVLVSPRDGDPNVDWHRDNITISLRHGWRPNTAYTITLLPGIADLRNNVLRTPTVITFTTGATIPATTIRGAIFDAVRGTPDGGARVEAVARPDTSLVYVTVADSMGRFTLPGVNPGTYLLRGYTDDNRNRALDSREAYDSMTVTLRDSVRSEMLTFVHDSLGPQLGTVSPYDTVTLSATFDTPLDPAQRLNASQFVLLAPDSTRVSVTAVTLVREDTVGQRDTTQRRDTSAKQTPLGQPSGAPPSPPAAGGNAPPAGHPAAPPGAPRGAAALDSARRALAQQDTTRRDTTPGRGVPPRPTRALLIRTVLLTLPAPLKPRTEYRLRAVGIRGPTGVVLTSERTFTTPPARTAPSDSTGARRTGPRTPTLPHPLRQQRP